MSHAEEGVRIGVAVVERDGRFLVGVRGPDSPLPGKAEFPGGKSLPGESSRDAAIRECLEEVGVAVEAIELLLTREFTYPHATVALEFWLCRPTTETRFEPLGNFRWVAAVELATLDFPAANAPVIDRLRQQFG